MLNNVSQLGSSLKRVRCGMDTSQNSTLACSLLLKIQEETGGDRWRRFESRKRQSCGGFDDIPNPVCLKRLEEIGSLYAVFS